MAPTVTSSRISLGDLTPNNIGQLRVLNSTLFPVNYSDKFYKEVLEVGELAKLGKDCLRSYTWPACTDIVTMYT